MNYDALRIAKLRISLVLDLAPIPLLITVWLQAPKTDLCALLSIMVLTIMAVKAHPIVAFPCAIASWVLLSALISGWIPITLDVMPALAELAPVMDKVPPGPIMLFATFRSLDGLVSMDCQDRIDLCRALGVSA